MVRRILFLVLFASIVTLVIAIVSSVAGAQPTGAPNAPDCTGMKLREWYVWGTLEDAWWFYWVYDWCYQPVTGWTKSYYYWDWYGPLRR